MLERLRAWYRHWFGYKAKDFGYNMPEIRRIYIGRCGGKGLHKYEDLNTEFALAHTHACRDDEKHGIVCVRKMNFIFWNGGEVLYHEYAHVLDKSIAKYGCIDKLAYLRYNGITDPNFQKLFHGKEFVSIMNGFGYVGMPWVSVPQLVVDAPDEWQFSLAHHTINIQ